MYVLGTSEPKVILRELGLEEKSGCVSFPLYCFYIDKNRLKITFVLLLGRQMGMGRKVNRGS